MRILARSFLLLAAFLACLALWAVPNRPVELAPLPGGKLPSVSYAPFREGQSPLTGEYATRDQIAEDLRLLAPEVRGLRTYTSREGLENVAPLARELGLKVTQGAWIDSLPAINEAEIGALIEAANRYPDVIERVIVGNEVLLRGTRTPEQLAAYLDRVRAAVDQPVGYADVWEFWRQHPELAEHVDFIAIHILPYWEDVPVGVDGAESRILEAYHAIHALFPDKPILIGEIGWPTAGRTRGPAETGLVEQARFINLVIRLAAREGFDYNLIEAFDQPWKSLNEGTVGANWGLFTTDRERKFHLEGTVVADPAWKTHFAASVLVGLVGLAGVLRRRRGLSTVGFGLAAAFALGLASGLVRAWHVAATQTYYPLETVQAWALWGLHAVVALALLDAVLRLFPEASARPMGAACPVLLARLGRLGFVALAAVAAVATFLLVFDGRYRDFPVPDYAGPVLAAVALGVLRVLRCGEGPAGLAFSDLFGDGSGPCGWKRPLTPTPLPRGERGFSAADSTLSPRGRGWRRQPPGEGARPPARTAFAFAILLPLGAVAIVAAEGWVNREAVTWAGLLLLMAVPFAADAMGRSIQENVRQ